MMDSAGGLLQAHVPGVSNPEGASSTFPLASSSLHSQPHQQVQPGGPGASMSHQSFPIKPEEASASGMIPSVFMAPSATLGGGADVDLGPGHNIAASLPLGSLSVLGPSHRTSHASVLSKDVLERADERPATKAPVAKRKATGRVCVECGATSTPQWREGPAGEKTHT
jgi:hypothetical protein